MRTSEWEANRAFEDSVDPVNLVRIYAACNNGPCNGGRKICPSPMACQRPEAELPAMSLVSSIVDLLMFWRK